MGVHKEFMERFGRLMDHAEEFDIVQARILICQALIKCADISNPVRILLALQREIRTVGLLIHLIS